VFLSDIQQKIYEGFLNTPAVKEVCLSRLYITKYSFSQRTINDWNKLSDDCVIASSINMFKNKIASYLARA